MKYTVEQVEPARARRELLRVWRDNLSVEGLGERKFAWTYERAPARPLSPFLLVARRGVERDVVGTVAVSVRVLQVGGRSCRAGLLGDLAVDRAHRSLLPALSLVRRAKRAATGEVALVYGFPNHRAEPVFLRAGYRRLGAMTRYVRVLRHGPYARRVVRSRAAARLAGAVADLGSRAGRLLPLVRSAARYRLVLSDAADERAEEVWAAAAGYYEIAGIRDAEFLAWRMCDHPEHRHRLAWLEDRRGGAARAYAAVGQRDGEVWIGDFFGPPDALEALFLRVAEWARGEGARSLSVRFLGDPGVVSALRRAGFAARDARRAVVVADCESGLGELGEPSRWFLTDADEDI